MWMNLQAKYDLAIAEDAAGCPHQGGSASSCCGLT